ncbi:hypothetical protein NDU88_011873 [Pleurodeles waltl]|uniref:Uncharacterized protein n=1 Tax=Pleurodeles waltl TaxID=8319 RepID=A0AAV7QYI6_PLEWA|nr:hypothetical protein NDU88_011873 [Pleurodeles waltl]
MSDDECESTTKKGKKKKKTKHLRKELLPSAVMEGLSTFSDIRGPSTSQRSGAPRNTKRRGVPGSTNRLGDPWGTEHIGTLDLEFGDQDPENTYDEYVFYLDQET